MTLFNFKPKNHIQVRFNTKDKSGLLPWRVIVDGEEQLASHVEIFGYAFGEKSIVDSTDKYNIACFGRVRWVGNRAIIKAFRIS